MPITSPVDFISGPNEMLIALETEKGKDRFLDRIVRRHNFLVNPSSRRVMPVITLAASLASGTPIALLTNGTVREARGFTSST